MNPDPLDVTPRDPDPGAPTGRVIVWLWVVLLALVAAVVVVLTR